MKLENHRLIGSNGQPVTFVPARHAGGVIKPRYIVMHYTAGGSADATVRYFGSEQARASAHFTIGRDGAIVQQVPCDRAAWHAGKSQWQGIAGLNDHSIGIELANWGKLQRGPDGFTSYTGSPVKRSQIVLAAHRQQPDVEAAWERFPTVQIDVAADIAAALLAALSLPETAIIGHDDISPGRKIDPGPAFEMDVFRGKAAGRGSPEGILDYRRVAAPSGLNLRTGPGLDYTPIAQLDDGTPVRVVFAGYPWAFVSVQENGRDGVTGYAHNAWLIAA